MSFNVKFSSKHPSSRRGFRLRGNTLILLFGFFLLGLFLHYKGRTEPVVAFWNDVRELLGIRHPRDRSDNNPYKAPEPHSSGQADNQPTKNRQNNPTDYDSEASATNPATDPPTSNAQERTSGRLFDFEKQVDFLLPLGRTSKTLVRHDGYVVRYDADLKNPIWVAYPLLAYEITGDADRDYERFMPDPAVARGTALPTDYTRSGYDRGHLAPAGDFKFSQQLTRESFYMSNVSPQAPQFNRGIWKSLEDQVRAWARRDGGLYVVTGPVLKPGLPTIGKVNDVAVPEQFYKVILYCRKGATPDIRLIGFLLPNEPSRQSLESFVVPVDTIEALTGLDFFDKIPDALEQQLEGQTPSRTVDQWFGF